MIPVTDEQRRSVEAWLRRRALPPRQRERLAMGKAVSLGQAVGAIAPWRGRRARTVRHWRQRFAAGGLAALLDAPRSGRPVTAAAAYHQALKAARATTPAALGRPDAGRPSRRLRAFLAAHTGGRSAPRWLRTLLKRHDDGQGRPKPTRKQLHDPLATAASAAALAAVEQQGGGGARPL